MAFKTVALTSVLFTLSVRADLVPNNLSAHR
jgi:hypothetical protein